MNQNKKLEFEFVRAIPETLKKQTIYISTDYATVAHSCCCGCGREVVTPLSPTDWKLTYDGESISLSPSIGNWSFECQSHYWIEKNTVIWAGQWTKEEIEAGRARDRSTKSRHFQPDKSQQWRQPPAVDSGSATGTPDGFLARLIAWAKQFGK